MLKRDLKLFFRSLLSSCGLLIILILVCTLICTVIVQSVGEAYTPVKVAIVDNEDSVLSRILVRAVAQTEQISEIMQTERMKEADAKDALKNGECAAIVVLPEGFLEDIIHLREAGGDIVVSEKLASHVAIVISAARAGEVLLAAGQYGIYCGEEILLQYNASYEDFERFYQTGNLSLLEEAAGANQKYFSEETVSYMSTGLKSESYFALCWTVAVLFLCSLFFVPLFLSDCTHSLLSRLYTLGVGNIAFIRCKISLLWAFRLILLALAAILLMPHAITVWGGYALPCILFGTLYITLIGACLTMCFGNGITANIVFAVSGIFLCGGIVPRQLLPDVVTTIGNYTPFGAAGAILSPVFGGAPGVLALVLAIVYAGVAVAMIILHLNGIRAGKGEAQI